MTPLHGIGNLIREALEQIPLSWVRWAFVALPGMLLVWVLCLPGAEVLPADEPPHWNRNLKIWAGAALLVQLVIYGIAAISSPLP
jgi:hypothetical protein